MGGGGRKRWARAHSRVGAMGTYAQSSQRGSPSQQPASLPAAPPTHLPQLVVHLQEALDKGAANVFRSHAVSPPLWRRQHSVQHALSCCLGGQVASMTIKHGEPAVVGVARQAQLDGVRVLRWVGRGRVEWGAGCAEAMVESSLQLPLWPSPNPPRTSIEMRQPCMAAAPALMPSASSLVDSVVLAVAGLSRKEPMIDGGLVGGVRRAGQGAQR